MKLLNHKLLKKTIINLTVSEIVNIKKLASEYIRQNKIDKIYQNKLEKEIHEYFLTLKLGTIDDQDEKAVEIKQELEQYQDWPRLQTLDDMLHFSHIDNQDEDDIYMLPTGMDDDVSDPIIYSDLL